MATECHSQFGFGFQPKITAAFDGGEITTDAGLLLVREFDDRLGLTAALRTAVPDPPDPGNAKTPMAATIPRPTTTPATCSQ